MPTDFDNTPPPHCSTGYIPRDPSVQRYGHMPYAEPFSMELIPEDEWKDRIDEIRSNGSILDLAIHRGMTAKNQNGFGYCWAYGGVRTLEMLRMLAGMPYVPLSAFGAASQIKNFRDQGGNTWDIIPFLGNQGVPSEQVWPNLDRDRSNVNQEMKEDSANYRMTEWFEMQENSFKQKMTALLNLLPVCAGYAWWGHMVCDCEPTYRTQGSRIEYGVKGWNSWDVTWGPYGNGTYEIWGDKAVSFDQVTGRVPTVVGMG